MNSERDELADIICRDDLYYDTGSGWELSHDDAADAILAAGYRKQSAVAAQALRDAANIWHHESIVAQALNSRADALEAE